MIVTKNDYTYKDMHLPETTNKFTTKCFVLKGKPVYACITAKEFASVHKFWFEYGYTI